MAIQAKKVTLFCYLNKVTFFTLRVVNLKFEIYRAIPTQVFE